MTEKTILLDRYPFQEDEYDHIMSVFERLEPQTEKPARKVSELFSLSSLGVPHPSCSGDIIILRAAKRMIAWGLDNVFVPDISGQEVSSSIVMPKATLLEVVASFLGRRSSGLVIQALLAAFGSGEERNETSHPRDTLQFVYSLASIVFQGELDCILPSQWSCEFLATTTTMPSVDFKRALDLRMPDLPMLLFQFFHTLILGTSFPYKGRKLELFSSRSSLPCRFQLSLLGLPPVSLCIYSSENHGLSFETYQYRLLSYSGPTVMVLHTKNDEIFGYYTGEPWKLSSSWVKETDTECFLFSLKPVWNVYPRVGNRYIQFLNRRAKGLSGLCIGGISADTPRILVNESFERCMASSVDTVFENGYLLENESLFFDIEAIEVWGLAYNDYELKENLSRGKDFLSSREDARIRQSRVDRSQFVEDFASGIMPSGLYEHREQARGRADFVTDDQGGYFVEGKSPSPQARSRS